MIFVSKVETISQEISTIDNVAISSNGSWALIGENGKVGIFTRTGTNWRRKETIEFSEGEFGTNLPLAINDHGTLFAIGSGKAPAKMGSVVVYERNGNVITNTSQLTGKQDPSFGKAVAISNDTIIITSDIALYVFNRSNTNEWVQTSKIGKNDHLKYSANDQFLVADSDMFELLDFGASVAALDDIIVVGAPGTNITQSSKAAISAGAVAVYFKAGSTWKFRTLLFHNPTDYANLGASVSLSSNGLVLAGAPGTSLMFNSTSYLNVGAAQLFRVVKNGNLADVTHIREFTANIGRQDLAGYPIPFTDNEQFGKCVRITKAGDRIYISHHGLRTYERDSVPPESVFLDGCIREYIHNGIWEYSADINILQHFSTEPRSNFGASFDLDEAGNMLAITDMSLNAINQNINNQVMYFKR